MATGRARRSPPQPNGRTAIPTHLAGPRPRRGFRLKELTQAHARISDDIRASQRGAGPRVGTAADYLGGARGRLTTAMERIIRWCDQDPSRMAIGLAAFVSATAFLEQVRQNRTAVRNPARPISNSR
jgi:hypothetical protein